MFWECFLLLLSVLVARPDTKIQSVSGGVFERVPAPGARVNGSEEERGDSRDLLSNSCLRSGAVFIDQYCNPLAEITLKDTQAQFDSIVELVRKALRGLNGRHPSLTFRAGTGLLRPPLCAQGSWRRGSVGNPAGCPHRVTKQPFMAQPHARLGHVKDSTHGGW